MGVFEDLFINAVAVNEEYVRNGLELFAYRLSSLPRIRVFVENSSPGSGHVASTCRLVRRIAMSAAATPVPGLGYAGTIELVCENTEDKRMSEFLPELNSSPAKIYGATLELKDVKEIEEPLPIGMTGGYGGRERNAKTLKVRYFLCLQPSYWDNNDHIEVMNGSNKFNYISLSDGGNFTFKERAYYIPLTAQPDWAVWKAQYPSQAATIDMIQYILDHSRSGTTINYQVLPTYAFNLSFIGKIPGWFSNLVGGLMYSQLEGGKYSPYAKPVVIVDVSDMDASLADRSGKKLALNISKIIAGERSEFDIDPREAMSALAQKYYQEEPLDTAAIQRRCDFFKSVNPDNRFEMFFAETSAQASEKIDAFIAANSADHIPRILYLNVKRAPEPVFNYLMAQRDLPAFFEGVNTANVALLHGKPYFHSKYQGYHETPFYPCRVLGGPGSDAMVGSINTMMNAFKIGVLSWPQEPLEFPCTIIGGFLRCIQSGSDQGKGILDYFRQVAQVYQLPQNDKFSLGVCYFNALLPPRFDESAPLSAGESPLNELYDKLRQAIVIGQSADLLPLLPEAIRDALIGVLKSVGSSLPIVADKLEWIPSKGESPCSVLLGGSVELQPFGILSGDPRMDIIFTAPVSAAGKLTADIRLGLPQESWSLPGLPWIVLAAPGVRLQAADTGGYPALAEAYGTWRPGGNVALTLHISQPLAQNYWLLSAVGEKPYPGVGDFYALLGGINPVALLPAPLNSLNKLGLARVNAQYNQAESRLDAISFSLVTGEPLHLLDKITLEDITLDCVVEHPADLKARKVSGDFYGDFRIGQGKDKARIRIGAGAPDYRFYGRLLEGKLYLRDIWDQFLSFLPNPISGDIAITDLDLSYHHATGNAEFLMGLDLEWTPVSGFTLKNLSLQVHRQNQAWNGAFAASMSLFTQNPVVLYISCTYLGVDGGWVFCGEMTDGSIKIGRLIQEYLGFAPTPEYDYGLKNLRVLLALQQKKYVFSGETDGIWAIPFLPGVYVENVQAEIGVDSQKSPAETSAKISGEVHIFGIHLKTFLNYDAKKTTFGLEWKSLKAAVEKTAGEKWIAAFTLENQTLGGMVETFVGWVTGSAFALGAPWSILNEITLDAFSLVFEFQTGADKSTKVHFAIAVGPISLGFATIKQISLRYVPQGTDKGLKLALIGSFMWQDDAINQMNDGNQSLEWDPSKPEEAPAPPGGGSKYFDLRLLALGQHIQVPDARDYKTVGEAVDSLRSLPEPQNGALPVGQPGQPTFSARNAWLIGADFGVLRVSEEKAKEVKYFLSVACIFNDPALYGLRIALDGDASKALKGLEFEIMYRQISDTVGCYSSQITLPEIMRRFDVGVFSLTMPVLGVAVYTNGDFLVDIGFPRNQDFSRSFAIEGIVPPAIPVTGAAGFYFGKLSSSTTDLVPNAANGWFNPVIAFGFGAQIGVGKSIDAGILKAGFSITAFGIIEGVIARWLPYADEEPTSSTQLQDSYYFSLKGSFGVIGKLYGKVDFAIIKADVSVLIKVAVEITYASYKPIPITIMALVQVQISLTIDLWLFSITIDFSFSLNVKATFEIQNSGTSPWRVTEGRQNRLMAARLRREPKVFAPCWDNLLAAGPVELNAWFAPALSVTGEGASTPEEQSACYVALFFLQTAKPAHGNNREEIALQRQANALAGQSDAFSTLALQAARWVVAAGLGQMSPAECDKKIVSEDYLRGILDYLSNPNQALPIPPEAAMDFLKRQFTLQISLPPNEGGDNGVLFPAVPALELDMIGGPSYRFGSFNRVSQAYLAELRAYFAKLAVQVQQEADAPFASSADEGLSVASYVFADYFVMLASQMVRAMLDALRNYSYRPGQATASIQDMLEEISQIRGIDYEAEDFILANGGHPLNAGLKLKVDKEGHTHETSSGDCLRSVAEHYGVALETLGEENLGLANLFQLGESDFLQVPHLTQYPVEKLLQAADENLAIQHLGAMVSRYGLHGLRLPTEGITPLVGGSLPEELGLYALTGQQVVVTEPCGLHFGFRLKADGVPWITLGKTGQDSLCFEVEGTNKERMLAVRDYARSHVMDSGIQYLQAGAASRLDPAAFSPANPILWRTREAPALPHGGKGRNNLRIWPLPQALKSVVEGREMHAYPAFVPAKSRFDEAAGMAVEAPVEHYGAGALVRLEIKRTENASVYEIMGAGSEDAMVLERIVSLIQNEDDRVESLRLLYQEDASGTLHSCCDSDRLMGIAQVNLSTITRPDHLNLRAAAEQEAGCLLNRKTTFLRLLWEAAITRDGGFYLWYRDTGEDEGIPDRLFDEHGLAEIFVLVLFAGGDAAWDQILPFTNILVTDTDMQSDESLLVNIKPQTMVHTWAGTDSLAQVADGYAGDISDLALLNAAVPLRIGASLQIPGGLYQVSATQPGADPAKIAAWFNVSLQSLKEANPLRSDWTSPLPLSCALRLPETRLKLSPGSPIKSLGDIAAYYSTSPEQLADANKLLCGLFDEGTGIQVRTGPFYRTPTQARGTAGLVLKRTIPERLPKHVGNSEEYGKLFVQNQFNMLGYSIAPNEDFHQSGMGVPVGPTVPDEQSRGLGHGRLYSPAPLQSGDLWNYNINLSYGEYLAWEPAIFQNSALPPQSANPYLGLGRLLQIDCCWQDVFGNRIFSDFSGLQAGKSLNRRPQLTGYTDLLSIPSRWPSATVNYTVEKGPCLCLHFVFDSGRYIGVTPAPQDIVQAVAAYTTLFYQLTDPNEITLSATSSLIPGSENLLPATAKAELLEWVESILIFFDQIASEQQARPPKDVCISLFLNPAVLNKQDIFPLEISLTIRRNSALVAPGMAVVPGVVTAETLLEPAMKNREASGLTAFAEQFTEAFSTVEDCYWEVATGTNRYTGANQSTLWVVRLGKRFGNGISLRSQHALPLIYAPRPLCRELQSRSSVPIYDYRQEAGIDFHEPTRYLDFTGVDLDVWLRETLSQLDSLLDPCYATALLLLDHLKKTEYLAALLDHKKTIAAALRELAIPVFAEDKPGEGHAAEAKEVYYQHMLNKLENAYRVQAILQFPLEVSAHVDQSQPPRLFGGLDSVPVEGLGFTSPKLRLERAEKEKPGLLNIAVSGGRPEAHSCLPVKVAFDGRYIEHQIAAVPGIEGYLASSWLHFARQPDRFVWPLYAELASFDLPLVLRQYPQIPVMRLHSGTAAAIPPPSPAIARARLWDYSFCYADGGEYLQDTVYVSVVFNVKDDSVQLSVPAHDLFDDLAQFATVYPQVASALADSLPLLDGHDVKPDILQAADTAVSSAVAMTERLAQSLERPLIRVGTAENESRFTIRQLDRDGILEVVLGLDNYPAVLETPQVDIEGYTARRVEDKPCAFRYQDSQGAWLRTETALAISERTVKLPNLDVTSLQNAKAGLHLRRNENLVEGRETAKEFIYRTMDISFTAPMTPSLVWNEAINISALDGNPIKQTLSGHLACLLRHVRPQQTGSISLQTCIHYSYTINQNIAARIRLPVLLSPGTQTENGKLADTIAKACGKWIREAAPSPLEARLDVELTLLTALTAQPMPILRFTGLYLNTADITDL